MESHDYDPWWAGFYSDLRFGLFDANCGDGVHCPRLNNVEDCIVLNMDPSFTDETRKDCIYIGNFNINPEKFWQEKCIVNPSKCEDNGFTVSLWIKYNSTWLNEPNKVRFLVGTDYGENPVDPSANYFAPIADPVIGWALWHYTADDGQNYLRVTVTDVNYLYVLDIVITDVTGVIWPPLDESAATFWTNIGFRWMRADPTVPITDDDYFIDVFIFGRKCELPNGFASDELGCIVIPNGGNSTGGNTTGVYPIFTVPGSVKNATAIYIGCQGDAWGTSSTDPSNPKKFHFTSAIVDDVAFWAWRLRDEEIPYLMGGKALPKSNIDPNRAKSVLIHPEPVNPYYAAADMHFKFIPTEYSGTDDFVGPYLGSVPDVFKLMTITGMVDTFFFGRADPRSELELLDEEAVKVTMASRLLSASSYIVIDGRTTANGIVTDCPHTLSACTNGLSMSIWLMLPSTASLRVMNDHYTILQNIHNFGTEDERIANTWELYTEGNKVFIRIGSAEPVNFPGDCSPLLGRWVNLAFSWKPELGIETYINGLATPFKPKYEQLHYPAISGAPAITPDINAATNIATNNIIVGSDGILSSSLAGMAVNDLVIWYQYIHPFETYKFMGMTETEAAVVWKANSVWTADYFVTRDRTLYWDKIGGMWLYPDTGVIIINVNDTDVKGKTVMTTGSNNGFLGLRDPLTNSIFLNQTMNCMANPFVCDGTGASYGGYFLIGQSLYEPGRHYILTTGNVDDHCIGVSMWIEVDESAVPNRVLWAELSRYTDYNVNGGGTANYAVWRLSIPDTEVKNETWYHYSLTWSIKGGLYFFINGVYMGWASRANIVGVDSITDAKPKWRYDNRAFMGLNSFYNGIMKNTGMFSIETWAVYHNKMDPIDVPKAFGQIENPWYGTATAWFDSHHLISNWQLHNYKTKLEIKNGNVKPKYSRAVDVTLTPLSARFNTPESRAPIITFHSADWANNLTVTLWLKVNEQTPGQIIFSTDKYLEGTPEGSPDGVLIRTIVHGLEAPGCGAIAPNNNKGGVIATWEEILGKWVHVAVSYNINGGVITCWFNTHLTQQLTTAPFKEPYSVVEDIATFVVGGIDSTVANSGTQDFEIHQLAIYSIAMSDFAQLGLMMGMPQQEAVYVTSADYYWSFSGPAHDLLAPQPFAIPADSSLAIDRRIQGKSLKTGKSPKACVSLGNFAGTCLTNVTKCLDSGFVFSAWLKLIELEANGYIFSTGGQQPGEPGIDISVNNGIIAVGVSNGTYRWSRLRIYINTADVWFNLMFKWSATAGIDVYVNGQLQTDDVAIGQSGIIRNAQLMYLFTNATVGCSNSDMSNVIPIEIDDIWFKTNAMNVPLTADDCSAKASYRNLFKPQMFDQTSTVPAYNPLKRTYAILYEMNYPRSWRTGDAMDDDKQCPGDLSKCPNGFTVSLWFRLPSLKQFSRALFSLRSSSLHGFQVFLDNQNLQQSLRVQMHNQTHKWLATVSDYVDVNKWLQLTAAWDTRSLTVYTLTRRYAPVFAQKSGGSVTDWSLTYSIGVTLDSGSWQYYVEDVVVWPMYIDDLRAYSLGVSCNPKYTDYVPDNLPTPPVLTASLTVAGICYLTSEDGKSCEITKEQWDRGAIQGLSSSDYFKILTMLQGEGASSSDSDDLGIAKYQPQVATQDLLSVKKQIMNGAIMTLTDRSKEGLTQPVYDFVQLCSSVLYPLRSKETWNILAEQGDNAMGIAKAIENFGRKVVDTLEPLDFENDTLNVNNSIDIYSDNIIFTAEILRAPKSGSNFTANYTFPNYERLGQQSSTFIKKWSKDDNTDRIVIPPEILNKRLWQKKLASQRKNNRNKRAGTDDHQKIVGSLFDTMGKLVPPVLDSKSSKYRSELKTSDIKMISRIISLTFIPEILDEDTNEILVILQHKTVPETYEPFCAFYTLESTWNTTGCTVVNFTTSQTTCKCTHLTNFAVLMQPVPLEIEPIHGMILSIISYIGIIISMLALVALFYILVTKSKLHGERTTIHINLIIALFLANLFFLFTGPAQYLRLFCRICAGMMHYFYTATFMWLLMECTYLFNAVVSGVIRGRLCCMIPLAWGVPVLVVTGVLAVDPNAYGSDERCWLSFDRGFIFAFIGPIILIVVLNAALLGLIVYNMPNTVLRRETKFYGKVLRGIRHAAVLLPLFGITWIFGLLAVNESLIVFQYFFVLLNSLQGLFIFLGFGWFQPEIRRYMCARDDDMDDEDDPHKDVVNSETDLKTILSTMPPPTPEMDRKSSPYASSYDVSETTDSSPVPDSEAAAPVPARQMSARQQASVRARTSFMRPATSLMRPKTGEPSAPKMQGLEEEGSDDEEALKARELMDYLLDGKRVKDVPTFAAANDNSTQQ